MNYQILETGSKGNCLILNDTIAIDMGVSYKRIRPHIDALQIVLLTHEHGDHLNRATVRTLAKNRPTLRWCVPVYLVGVVVECGVRYANIDVIRNTLDYGAFGIRTHPLHHDAYNVGYSVIFSDGVKVFYATDTKSIDHITAFRYDFYFVEANYTEDGIMERISEKEATGEYVHEYRTMETHLSKEKADAWLMENAGDESVIEYMHGHIDAI